MKRAFTSVLFMFLFSLAFLYGSAWGQVQTPCSNSLIPPFIAQGVKPNILIILDTSNSMDEDFNGNAVGSYAPDSKSVAARQALQNLVKNLVSKANVGIMTYTLPGDVSAFQIHGGFPFASYDPDSYCPDMFCSDGTNFESPLTPCGVDAQCTTSPYTKCVPDPAAVQAVEACDNYCANPNEANSQADQATCNNYCTQWNPNNPALFTQRQFPYGSTDANGHSFPDQIIGSYSYGNSTRAKYCGLTYPKTSAMNLTDNAGNTNTVYYNQPDPFYDPSNQGTEFGYCSNYSSSENANNSYAMYWHKKAGTSDALDSTYGDLHTTWGLAPTDSDYAHGFYNFGQRFSIYYVGPTWFSQTNVTGQQGYLHAGVGDMTNTTLYNNVMDLLEDNSGNSTNYMSCTKSNKNACVDANGNPYIINAGNTPTAGTLATALSYFAGNYKGFCFNSSGMTNGASCTNNSSCSSSYPSCSVPSPITASCQKNYIILVTDGLPGTNLAGQNGSSVTLSSLMSQVTSEITSLAQGVSYTVGSTTSFPVLTYVLGIGSEAQENTNLDAMAVAGGTAVNGHAYYAANANDMTSALNSITANIMGMVAAGSSVSILSQGQTQNGANMLQGVFYPSKYYGTTLLTWPGYLYNWWFYSSPNYENIRENNDGDNILDLKGDYGLSFTFTTQNGLSVNVLSDPTGSGNPTQTVATNQTLDQLSPLWEAGKTLWATDPGDRQIYTPGNSATGLVNFDTNNSTLTNDPSPLGSPSNFDACLQGANDPATLTNLINYVRGTDISNTFCSDGNMFENPLVACTSNSDCKNSTYSQCLPDNCRNRTVGLCTDALGNPSTTGCNSSSDCSGTYSTCTQEVWKLGDIIYSTPKVEVGYNYCGTTDSNGNPVFDSNSTLCSTSADCTSSPSPDSQCLAKEGLVFVGANDGMLHAFQTGALTNYGLTGSQIEKTTGISSSDMGKEAWAFVPQNSLPYLRCLADPAGCHLYYNDLSPYIVTMQKQTGTDANGNPTYTPRIVLIGGMRLGGGSETGSGNFCMNSNNVSNGTTCTNTSSCSSQKYCLDSAWATNGQTCSSGTTANCTAPYNAHCSAFNASCSSGYSTNAPSDSCPGSVISSANATGYADPVTGQNGPNCTGLSSYYALDITDPKNPILLWEFSDPFLGYSYSGPAVIHKWAVPGNSTLNPPTPNSGHRYYVMFLSGPTEADDGSSIQDLRAFVLTLDPTTLRIASVYTNDFTNINNGFGGRLFTQGLDVTDPPVNSLSDPTGYTDFVFFGYGYAPSGKTGSWKGGIGKVWTGNADPTLALNPGDWNWDVTTYANLAQLPITAQVATETCFTNPTTGLPQWYLYAGTGRYFLAQDIYGSNGQSSTNYIMGVPFTCDQNNNNCGTPNLNSLNQSSDACSALQSDAGSNLPGAGWQIDLDTPASSTGYLDERVVTDPTVSEGNTIYFTTSEPTSDPCGYGGQSRVWGLNCATGGTIADQTCPNYTVNTSIYTGSIFLQTSTGAIEVINDPGANGSGSSGSFNGKTTVWYQGMPPESSPQKIGPANGVNAVSGGQLIQWYEK